MNLMESATRSRIFFVRAIILIAVFSVLFLLLSFTSKAQASFLDTVKALFSQGDKKEFTIESDISLVPGRDENNNSQIDAGDVVRFTYTIINPLVLVFDIIP